MGILDDAIREHLDLKRSHGATDSELRRLEDEAFGPPSRPGEPDFPESEEAPAQAGNGAAAETAVVDAPAPEAEGAPAPEVDVQPGPEQPAAEHPLVEATPDAPGHASEPDADDQTTVYDHISDEELPHEDLEPVAEEPPSDEAPAPEEPHAPGAPDVPIESLETVEHPFPDEVVEPETSPDDDPESSHEEPGAEAPPAIDDEPEAPPSEEDPALEGEPEEGDDVLADTPEFLKDAPEDDELWFEQGEPKDFDF
jgi:hypothetical protein